MTGEAVRKDFAHIERAHWLRHELHDLCQPLTRLQWRMEIGLLTNDERTLRDTVTGGLDDLRELVERVRRLRAQLVGGQELTEGDEP